MLNFARKKIWTNLGINKTLAQRSLVVLLALNTATTQTSFAFQNLPKQNQEAVLNFIIDSDIDLEQLKKDSLQVRKLGASYRIRFLEGKNLIPESIYQLKSQTNKLKQASPPSKLGPGSTGGGFTNYRGGLRNLVNSIERLKKTLRYLPKESFDTFLSPRFQRRISTQQLLTALDKIEYSYYIETMSVDPEGRVDNLDADFEGQGDSGHIILMKDFFTKYGAGVLTEEFFVSITRTILHEITHLYGIGLTDDEESYRLSFEMTEILFGNLAHFYRCGSLSNVAEGAKSCSNYFSENKELKRSAQDPRAKLIQNFHNQNFVNFINQTEDGELMLILPVTPLRKGPAIEDTGRIVGDLAPLTSNRSDYSYPFYESLNSELWWNLWFGNIGVFATKTSFELETGLTNWIEPVPLPDKSETEVERFTKAVRARVEDIEFGLKKNQICESFARTLGNSNLGKLKWTPKVLIDWDLPINETRSQSILVRTDGSTNSIKKVALEYDFRKAWNSHYAVTTCVAERR